MTNYLSLSLKKINELLKNKTIKPIDLVNEAFLKIEKYNLNCFITLNKEEAIKKAKELENLEVDNLLFGIPIAITFTPKVFSVSSFLAFSTPAPGTIPVSAICIVLLILSMLLEARLSITITNFGLTLSTIPFIISDVSIPVVPITPGDIAATLLKPSSTSIPSV